MVLALMKDAKAAAWRTLKLLQGQTVTYRIGEFEREIIAVRTQPRTKLDALTENITLESRNWDFLMDPDEPKNEAGETIQPDRGHEIETADGSKYAIQPTGNAELPWRYSDGDRTWRRVHSEEA